jgi:hypothetical protein
MPSLCRRWPLSLAALTALSAACHAPPPNDIAWSPSLEQARAEAAARDRPVAAYVHFHG